MKQDQNPGNILVVDDNEMNRDLLCRRLKKLGHVPKQAVDGLEAIELLKQHSFDLVLLDIMMPGMNGYEVLEEIKKNDQWRVIPVIMISALTELDSVIRCIEMGAEDYLPKPFKTVLLNARVKSCLEKKWHQDQLQEEKQRCDDLLKVILPGPVLEELKATNAVKPRLYENVVVLFADVVDFTRFCDNNPPEVVVNHLQDLVDAFEDLTLQHGIQKIKTIGDAFMGTAGLIEDMEDHVQASVQCGLEMIRATEKLNVTWKLRVGIHCGPVMGGIVGHRQYLFDVWGDTVNTAARIQERGAIGSVSVSEEVWKAVSGGYKSEAQVVDVKGKGEMEIFCIGALD